MKLPIQSQPVMRSVSSVRISAGLMSGVTASECGSECAWAVAGCAATAPFGYGAVASCLIGIGATSCRDCVWEILKSGPGCGGPGQRPCL
jgi:hypothetical protein